VHALYASTRKPFVFPTTPIGIPSHRPPPREVAQNLTRLALRRLTEDDVPHLGTATLQSITWSTVSGFKGLENDVIIVAGLTDIESDWHRGFAYVGMSRARTRLHVIIHEDCDKKPAAASSANNSLREPVVRIRMKQLRMDALSRLWSHRRF
jgi:hypothetical protein